MNNQPPYAFQALLLGGLGLLRHHHERLSKRDLMSALRERDGECSVSIANQDKATAFYCKHGARACRAYAKAILRSL